MGYEPPAWGADGANAHGVALEVIKGGLVVETLALPATAGRSFALAGRAAPPCDLQLQHPSVSRVHAALQFDARGALFVRDLGSTHGTFVNKRRLPAHEFARLNVGDVLAFGESTRLYAVLGPQELLPPERQPRRAEKEDKEDEGATWGFREDAVDDEDDEEEEQEQTTAKKEKLPDYLRNLKEEDTPYESKVKKSELNEKDQKLFQQLQAKIAKMENLKREKSRILAKQHQLSGLSDGQQQQLSRNEERIEALMREIQDLEDRIHAKNAQRSDTAAAKSATRKKPSVNEALYGYDSDEDDFYDRTRSNQQKHAVRKQQVASLGTGGAVKAATNATATTALTADDIEANVKSLEADLKEVERKLAAAPAQPKDVNSKEEEEEIDSLDSFMNATSEQLVASDRAAVTRRRDELQGELKRQQQLLAIARPALPTLPESSANAKATEAVVSNQIPKADESSKEEGRDAKAQERSVPTNDSEKINQHKRLDAIDKPLPQVPMRKARSPEPPSNHADKRAAAPEVKKRRVVGPSLPPVEQSGPQAIGETNTLEGGESVWVPPKNQTGDGRTALNDKYGY